MIRDTNNASQIAQLLGQHLLIHKVVFYDQNVQRVRDTLRALQFGEVEGRRETEGFCSRCGGRSCGRT